MTKPTPDYLRLVDPTEPSLSEGDDSALLARTCEAFEQVTGWTLQYAANPASLQNPNLVWSAPVDPGVGASLGLIRPGFLPQVPAGPRGSQLADAVALAEVMGRLWSEIAALRDAVRSREAELASDVPVVVRRETAARTAERFEAILKAGAEAVGCQAAALYLLDAGTTSLKLRACFGLPKRKLLEPARELAGALADLEALLGHAVVLSEPDMNRYWHCPELSGASVCVPVSSQSTQLGTLWIFSDMPRDFTDQQTNLIEVVAGRLATELEREVLLTDARQSQTQRREIANATGRQSESLPRIAPILDRWQVAGRLIDGAAANADSPWAGTFFDWFAAADGATALALGAASEKGFSGALVAAELRSALRAQADRLVEVDQALTTAHQVLASLSAGSQGASAFCGLLPDRTRRTRQTDKASSPKRRKEDAPPPDEIRFAAAGQIQAWVVTSSDCRQLVRETERLAVADAAAWSEIRVRLNPGESLVVYAAGSADALLSEPELLAQLSRHWIAALPCDAERLAAAVGAAIEQAASASGAASLSGVSSGAAAGGAILVVQPL